MIEENKIMNLSGGKVLYDDLRDRIEERGLPENGKLGQIPMKKNNGVRWTDIPADTSKADKVTGATNGNFAALDSNGNLIDSGHKHSDYLTEHQTIPVKNVRNTAGTSLVDKYGDAVIPRAHGTEEGMIHVPEGGALDAYYGALSLITADSAQIKAGTEALRPIAPFHQHESTFFGLAKAAGDTTQAQTYGSGVSGYTDSAKTKIQNMLNVPSVNAIASLEENNTANKNYSVGDLFVMDGKLYKATTAIAQYGAIITEGNGQNCEEVSINSEFARNSDIPTVPVQDVQVNGTSILSNGVANVPLASTLTPGVARVDASYGISIGTAGLVAVVSASSNQAKLGTETYKPITPSVQNASTFYGLAKAAGDTTQASSSNPVGTYTDDAKTAIQTMLDVPSNADVQQAIANVNTMKIHICTSSEYNAETNIPTISQPDTQTLYLVPNDQENNLFIEWAYVNNAWERFGSADIDLSNYVQKDDYATSSDAGVVKTSTTYGTMMSSNNELQIARSGSDTIKTGFDQYRPIVPYTQHEAAFYGLAKAAGDTTQSQSDNEVGTYTDDAKTAIRNMIGAAAQSEIPSVPVQDVQVNSTSVLNNGVANVPIASSSALGVVKIPAGSASGLTIVSGELKIYPAAEGSIKSSSTSRYPITPAHVHEAAFYGLAKAAGDTTQASSSNAVGTYTENAKSAIRSMLGATSPDIIAVEDATPTSSDTKIWIIETASSTVTVPTVAEMESALGDYVTKSNSVFNDTISGGRKAETVVGQYSFAFGYEVEANNSFSHSEGAMTIASGSGSHAEGVSTKAIGSVAHAEGYGTSAKGTYSHAEANGSVAYGQSSHAEGDHTLAIGYNSHSEGVGTLALGNNAHAEGYCLAANIRLTGTVNTTQYTFTIPSNNWEIEINDIIYYSTMVKYVKVAEVNNDNNVVTVNGSFGGDALSNANVLIYRYYAGNNAHSENGQTMASGNYSHAQGKYTIANTSIEDVSGCYNVKTNIYPTWVANTSYIVGDRVTKETNSYECNTANNDSTWNVEKWTLLQYNGLYSTVVGNGLDEEHRANSYALDWDGNGHYAGDVYVGCNNDSTGGSKLAKVSDIAVNDVQVNGTSVLSSGAANIPIGSEYTFGVFKYGQGLTSVDGKLKTYYARSDTVKAGTNAFDPIVPSNQHQATFYGLAKAAGDTTQSASNNAIGSYTNEAKASIQSMLGVEGNVTVVNISDTNPVITALPNTRYICGEISTISITPYSFGITDVVFTSGTSAAILTLPSTVIMPEWFDASNLEQNRIYEINISDGIYGSVMSWPS